ncbi:hypothetical protein CH313_18515 [Streptomyces sp. TSRI0384-2]|uniref:Lipoprotein n=4 Tax=Streptomyces TaxID=1883 RepID=A0A8H9LJP6_9ACTN|nr:hypothetical protein [Streptomyces sp. BRB081]NEE32765.1 hypothetical protein [Streptomyces sp. SID7982]NEE60682.1 hypothetical protein [Streptomyces sp. SID8455]PJM81959.1 hypothetical protein CH313_18515 [Streptomyces sp. TSRI0384-2]QNE82624.1 hypothetical protein F0345_17105 [Streptomyces rutgersensis]RPK89078.1 hypothetical protein EES47_12270 [Streptomyces sp. ADI98-12]SUO93788.1 Uncharacterised protein [Streptomyces griseus]GFH69668.1 hypothetical protein Sdia_04360 [Streptomyces di
MRVRVRCRGLVASVALVLGAGLPAVACSSASGPAGAPGTPTAVKDAPERVETGRRAPGAPATTDGPESVERAECEGSAEEIPARCAVEPSFAGTDVAEPADGPPATP